MSEVEAQLRIDMTRAFGSLARAAQHAGELIAAYVPEPVKAEQPERFEHRDHDDNLVVRPHHAFDQTLVAFVNGDGVRLRQDAVNRLAQYLDWYRTDRQCSPDTNGAPEPGVPVTYPLPTGFDRCTGTYEGFRCRRLVNHDGEHA